MIAGPQPRPATAPAASLDDAPDFAAAPMLVFWEATRACGLACGHCRARAVRERDPAELTGAEADAMFRDLRAAGTRRLVVTGGDPLERPDLFDRLAAAREAGLAPALSPSVTPRLTAEALRRAAAAGVTAVSLSLDGAGPATHDTFRGVPGAFAATVRAAADVRAAGCVLRVNTTVTRTSLPELPALAELAAAWGAETWAVFFLVPTGRARLAMQITPAECETTLRWLVTLADTAPFRVKTTEAPHYRRVALEGQAARAGRPVAEIARGGRSGVGRFVPGLNDGRGIAFVSHTGQVCPSGFLPLAVGNVRRRPVSACYRESALFRSLRDPSRLRGPCGRCPFRALCGGSRARAFAATGCPLDSDPLCAYEPPARGSPEAAA